MGKNTDKLYVTQSESSGVLGKHSSSSGIATKKTASKYRKLPFYYCALTLQPWEHPVCHVDEQGQATLFDLLAIVPWLAKKGSNPATGKPLDAKSLVKLNFSKNDEDDFCDPVTMKVFNDHTHIAAVKTTGNVYAYETIETLNYKTKSYKDLLTDEPFTKADVIIIQDPHSLGAQMDLTAVQQSQVEGSSKLKQSAVGESASQREKKVEEAKLALQRFRTQAEQPTKAAKVTATAPIVSKPETRLANYSTGMTAAAFTNSGMSVSTAVDRAELAEADWLLKPRKVKIKGLGVIRTNFGSLDIELDPEFAPKAVYNFVKLAKQGYYDGVSFHRNIPGFMVQGGDPTGRGTGGTSIFGKEFETETLGTASHSERGRLSMANKGPNTNSSQFFITYEPCTHLDKKHTLFGRVIGHFETLDLLERVPSPNGKPQDSIIMETVEILVDPFEEYLAKEKRKAEWAAQKKQVTEDDLQTWTNKPAQSSHVSAAALKQRTDKADSQVGKYMKIDAVEVADDAAPPAKKVKRSGFGNFSGW
ncbi:peptidyl-prolyl cis-trans isomerase cyp8 [Protomyces lactucae-debilis]|uniref:RING-type E3 ubiquitin transferase n=1 Tax=Protomyces lactucae-debilis TaxID=2754530 RepID=A0A1Y2EWR8_PROLT|nr:peptidyl-prolyl cis-trans isomerase cyp8 [Protomyces lactucae-debilis]ORY76029.1 peptidyl-prolyl cis-trans isomerase cyp8 [Protomyces lactucae-debilis]